MTTNRTGNASNPASTQVKSTIKTYTAQAARPSSAPVKMERILYIGIGGTGGRSLLKTKRRFLETYGFIPTGVKFLHIDTDSSPRLSGALSLAFEDFEQVQIRVIDPMAVVNNVREIAVWWPKGVLADSIVDGCGQRRINGRLALFFSAPEVFRTIAAILEELQSPHLVSSQPQAYEIPATNATRVVLVGSDCGGTGSGMAVDIGRYIREILFAGNPSHRLLGFFVSHGAFEKKPHTDLIEANKYAFYKELDYLAGSDPRQVPAITLHDATLPRDDRKGVTSLSPFDKIFVADARNDLFSYQLEDIEDSLSRVMFLVSGYLTGNAISIWRNTAAMPWHGKQPILSGIGESEIVFRVEELCAYAADSLVQKLVDTVLIREFAGEVSDTDVLVKLNSWQLVEAEKDQVIDRILDPHSANHVRIPGRYDKETANNLLTVEQGHRKKNVDALRKSAKNAGVEVTAKAIEDLKSYVHSRSNRPGGLLYLDQFLRQCHEFCTSYREMMVDEITELVPVREMRTNAVNKGRQQVSEAAGRFFGRSSGLKKAYESLAAMTRDALIIEAEILRREQAAGVYQELLKEIGRLRGRVKTLRHTCEMVSNKSIARMQAVVSRRRQKRTTEIEVGDELAEQAIRTADVTGYLVKFSETPCFLDLSQRNADELFEEFNRFCLSLQPVQTLGAATLDSVLAKMDRAALRELLAEMDRFSLPLWQWDLSYRNVNEGRKTENIFLIGCGSADDNIFTRCDLLQYLPSKGAATPAIVGTGDLNRIVCIRIEDAIPPFALKSLAACKGKYDRAKRESVTMRDRGLNRIAYEIDGRLENSLPDLFPSREKKEDIQIWALAHIPDIFDLISKNGTYYYAFSQKNGRASDDFKIRLAQGRVVAFGKYMQNEEIIAEHRQLITQRGKQIGDAELAAKLIDYRETILMEQVRANTEPELKQLVEKEIGAITDFINQLSSF